MILALLCCSLARAQPTEVPVLLHMGTENGEAVAADAFVEQQLALANQIYRPLGFELVLAGRRSHPHARMLTREDRDALAPLRVQGVVNWFVVAQLMDVDEPGRERRGVHWHLRGTASVRYVIVSAIAGERVLAHELGHFFGNPAHSEVPGNLMCYQQTEALPVLDDSQRANVLRTLRGMRKRGELLDLQSARRFLRSRS